MAGNTTYTHGYAHRHTSRQTNRHYKQAGEQDNMDTETQGDTHTIRQTHTHKQSDTHVHSHTHKCTFHIERRVGRPASLPTN